ncbi:class II D-tagatose-bisphosphate aldolase, non-catalytic subunit [Pararhodospirillum photometricum]|uniref:Putative tagatose 6-phosphate kinase 1 n=1 Tax=Pararhodospirillum photometricum DSM 122 TaxID=1150469 RepID=H6SR33_PARPM|nr:class II D-tagatose-bisphosphate aldolase, non-catalytic subunit [Pararhodospirillum photometricum]CCG09755.1 Putative tagatose 6-phosphate kinase 1 [Pararhodospirillum photometricum DSM 122]
MKEVIAAQGRGEAQGICSLCTAHPLVIRAALEAARDDDAPVLIEATANQVNQFGGYTGMTPAAFRTFVEGLADAVGFPRRRVRLGGDHLGPTVWRSRPAEEALALSRALVAEAVAAGFTKIHLDASMALAGECDPLDPALVAERAADLAAAAEAATRPGQEVLYVIGTEVPVPGGETEGLSAVRVSAAADVAETLDLHRLAFARRGLHNAFERVGAVVVQPGVDFDHTGLLPYDPGKTRDLVALIQGRPGLVYEAHSTDFQSREALRALVEDRFAILKVGPALTYALREGLFALAAMEDELIPIERRSCLRAVVERIMLEEPEAWARYYAGAPGQRRLLRAYSQSDRIRYYWTHPEVAAAVERLLANLAQVSPSEGLIRQFAGLERARLGRTPFSPQALLADKVRQVLEDYRFACTGVAEGEGGWRRAG